LATFPPTQREVWAWDTSLNTGVEMVMPVRSLL